MPGVMVRYKEALGFSNGLPVLLEVNNSPSHASIFKNNYGQKKLKDNQV